MKRKTSSNRAVALLLAVVMVFIAIATPIPASAATVTNSSSNSDYVSMPFFADATASTSTPGAVRVFSAVFGTQYTQGEIISYRGFQWEVLQSFTFFGDPNWHPGIAPSLWRLLGECTGYTHKPQKYDHGLD